MSYLLDTNILARLANSADVRHLQATRAVVELHRQREKLHITPQVLIEFRNVATRAVALNGLGLSIADTDIRSAGFEKMFTLLPDTPEIFSEWKKIVGEVGVIGKQVHDARLVAVCHAHQISHLLTFDVPHFARMAAVRPGISIVEPASV